MTRPIRIERRWPVALAIVGVLFVLAMTPARVRLFPSWLPYAVGVALILPMAAVWLSGARAPWRSIERRVMLLFSMFAEIVTIATVWYLAFEMVNRPEDFSGRQLLATSIGAWFTNVLAFSIVYWHLDRGGPEARANEAVMRPDWLFPQTGVPDAVPPDWRPIYVDYLALSFSTATAFSATDVAPLTSRAKVLMMVESAVSLSTLVMVASRAINLLGI